jgi:hypothetical protein
MQEWKCRIIMKKRRTHIIEDETVMGLRDEDWDVAVVF